MRHATGVGIYVYTQEKEEKEERKLDSCMCGVDSSTSGDPLSCTRREKKLALRQPAKNGVRRPLGGGGSIRFVHAQRSFPDFEMKKKKTTVVQ